MKKNSPASTITLVDLIVLVKAGAVGLLIMESFLFSIPVALVINNFVKNHYNNNGSLYIFGLSCFFLLILMSYAACRDAHKTLWKIIKSCRLDLLIVMGLGSAISLLFSGIGTKGYQKVALAISPTQAIGLLILPLTMATLLVFRTLYLKIFLRNKDNPSFFMNDIELQRSDEDLMNFKDSAERFAIRLWNGGSRDSLVFGIDAPWGIGKSSFINFCIEHLRKKQNGINCIIYHFNPLKYQEKTNFLEKLIDGLSQEIQKEIFHPEMHSLIANYSKLIRGKIGLTFFGIRFEGANNIDDAYEDLESSISRLNKKIVVVIDDLDRLSFSEIKEVLFSIKKSFMLPNVSYLLSYDTENIISLDKKPDDAERVREFLEKFVNIKTSLFLDSSELAKYISENFDRAVKKNLLLDPETIAKTKETITSAVEIYGSPGYHHYQEFIGDIRKIKRLINTIISLEIEKTEFDSSDFDKQDLLHLLLIQLNYPHIFRKIFNTETNGKSGYFSLIKKYDEGFPKPKADEPELKGWQNSTMYTEYISGISTNQKFLLDKIFSAKTRLPQDDFDRKINEEHMASFACFNTNSGRRNLEQYLNLIARLSKPAKQDQYRFYLNQKNNFKNGQSLDEIFEQNDFSFDKGESPREQLWRVIVNSAREFPTHVANQAISYLIKNLCDYSLLDIKKIDLGLRDKAAFYLIKLLDNAAWSDSTGNHVNNTDKNVSVIAHQIFGENSFKGKGVLEQLMSPTRGALGLFDVLIFRLYCCADRDNEFYNLQRSLSKHGSPDAPTSGLVSVIAIAEMREISQKIFDIFAAQYINKKINLHKIIDDLSIDDIIGKYQPYLTQCVADEKISSDDTSKAYKASKTRIKSFITYQLGNTLVNSGVGCGYYDAAGADDNKGIASQFNTYLFDVCFTQTDNNEGFSFFIDYLMISYPDFFSFDQDDGKRMPTLQSGECQCSCRPTHAAF